jgi:hypothetical protein
MVVATSLLDGGRFDAVPRSPCVHRALRVDAFEVRNRVR